MRAGKLGARGNCQTQNLPSLTATGRDASAGATWKDSDMRVTKDQQPAGAFVTYAVEDVRPGDIHVETPGLFSLIQAHGAALGLRKRDLPAFTLEVESRYATRGK